MLQLLISNNYFSQSHEGLFFFNYRKSLCITLNFPHPLNLLIFDFAGGGDTKSLFAQL